MMEEGREVQLTDDGSHTVWSPQFRQYYHSYFGALAESRYVFIQMGWDALPESLREVSLFEMGLGTGLDVLLTWEKAQLQGRHVRYTAAEAYPLEPEEVRKLNHPELMGRPEWKTPLEKILLEDWGTEQNISEHLTFRKVKAKLDDIDFPSSTFDLVYYDAFAPNAQPELWTQEVFEKIFIGCKPGAVMVTYCAKGYVRRNMIAAGWSVERLPGPPGKREMLRARKPE